MNPSAPLSVVHVLAPARFGGLETVLHHLATGLHGDDRVDVTVVPVLGLSEAAEHPFVRGFDGTDVRIVPVEIPGRGYRAERRAVREILEKVGASVLHTHGYRPDVMDSGVAARLRIPRVTTVHGFTGGGRRNRFYETLQRRVFRRFDGVIAVSAKLERELVASGIPDSVVHVVRNAFPSDGKATDKSTARSALGLPADKQVVGWVGRLSHEKAPDVFVQAAAEVSAEDVHFSVIGSGPELERCRELASELGLSDRVHFHGQLDGAGTLLKAFDALALTSWTEGTPMVLLEAMARGVPIVSTDVGGIPDVVSDDEAWLMEAGDVAGISRAMTAILQNRDLAASKATSARGRLERDLSIDSWVDRHVEIYRSLSES